MASSAQEAIRQLRACRLGSAIDRCIHLRVAVRNSREGPQLIDELDDHRNLQGADHGCALHVTGYALHVTISDAVIISVIAALLAGNVTAATCLAIVISIQASLTTR